MTKYRRSPAVDFDTHPITAVDAENRGGHAHCHVWIGGEKIGELCVPHGQLAALTTLLGLAEVST